MTSIYSRQTESEVRGRVSTRVSGPIPTQMQGPYGRTESVYRRYQPRGENEVEYQHECRADPSADPEGAHEGQPDTSVDPDTSSFP